MHYIVVICMCVLIVRACVCLCKRIYMHVCGHMCACVCGCIGYECVLVSVGCYHYFHCLVFVTMMVLYNYYLFHLHLFVSPMMRSKNSSVKNRRKKSCWESPVPAGKCGPACVL